MKNIQASYTTGQEEYTWVWCSSLQRPPHPTGPLQHYWGGTCQAHYEDPIMPRAWRGELSASARLVFTTGATQHPSASRRRRFAQEA